MTPSQCLCGLRGSFTRSCRSVESLRRWTRGLQAGVAVLLVVAAVTGGLLSYKHGRGAELRQFKAAFDALGSEAAHTCSVRGTETVLLLQRPANPCPFCIAQEAVDIKYTAAKSGASFQGLSRHSRRTLAQLNSPALTRFEGSKWLANHSIYNGEDTELSFSSMSADILHLGNASLGGWLLVVPDAERRHVEELGSSLASHAQFVGSLGFQVCGDPKRNACDSSHLMLLCLRRRLRTGAFRREIGLTARSFLRPKRRTTSYVGCRPFACRASTRSSCST